MGKGSQTTTSNTSTGPDPQAGALYRQILTQAQNTAATPYQSYTGQLTAPINAEQNLGISGINANAGFASPYIQQAAGFAANAATPVTADQIAQYQNPYTQQVIDAIQKQFSTQNQQQQSQLLGSTAAQGALGGDRQAVAQSLLAGQQQQAQAPVIAGQYQQSYNTALQTALAEQQQQAQAAYSLGNIGVAGQNAALTGAGAQIGAGTLQQTTQQAQNTAAYNQFLQQMAYPFQTTQWLAGVGTGVGSQLGGTSTGTTTGSAPNQFGQYAGLALGAASLFLKDGGKVPGFALGGTPYADASGYVPSIQISPGKGAPGGNAPSLPGQTTSDPMKLAQQVAGFGENIGKGSGFGDTTPTGATFAAPLPLDGADMTVGSMGGIDVPTFWAQGGAVQPGFGPPQHFDDGGTADLQTPTFDQRFSGTDNIPPPATGIPGDPLAFVQPTPSAGFTPDVAPSPATIQPGQDSYVPATPASFAEQTPVPSAGFGPSPVQPTPEVTPAPGVSTPPASPNGYLPRGLRNNNPGNIEDGPFARSQPGYVGSDGRFAKFASPEAGQAAQGALLSNYGRKGVNTINGIINRWAPAADGNDVRAYAASVARETGLDPNQPLNLDDPAINQKIRTAMAHVENGTGPGSIPSDVLEAKNYNRAAGFGQPADEAALPPNAQPTQAQKKSGFGFSNLLGLSDETKHALLAAGLGMMASRSPFLGVAIGEGGERGLATYMGEKQQQRTEALTQQRINLESQRLSQSAEQAAKRLQLQTEQLKQSGEQHKETLAEQMRQHNLALRTPVKIGQTRTGQDLFALPKPNADGTGVDFYPIDPHSGQVSPTPMGSGNPLLQQQPGGPTSQQPSAAPTGFQPAGYQTVEDQALQTVPTRAAMPTASAEARNEDYLREIAKDDPKWAANVKAVADYRLSPQNLISLRGNQREKFMGDVQIYDPTYDQRRYNQTNRAITGWAQSPEGRATRSLSVTVEHLGTAEELGKALQNGNVQVLNSLKNAFKTQFGYEGPPNFEFAKQIVSDEIAKAVIGGQNAEQDRQGLQAQLKLASSPEQLQGVIHTAKQMMAGQVIGLQHTYEMATGLHNFDQWLTPRARLEVSRELADRDAKLRGQTVGGQTAPQTAPQQRKVGDTVTTPKGTFRWNGAGWDKQ